LGSGEGGKTTGENSRQEILDLEEREESKVALHSRSQGSIHSKLITDRTKTNREKVAWGEMKKRSGRKKNNPGTLRKGPTRSLLGISDVRGCGTGVRKN